MKKMNKMEFAEELKKRIEVKFDAKVDVKEIFKINAKKTGLAINDDKNYVPVIYIDDCYKSYENELDFDGIAEAFLNFLEKEFYNQPMSLEKMDLPLVLDDVKDNIIFQLINTEQNKEFLAGVPNRPYHDLSIIYRWVVSDCADEFSSAVINNALIKTLDVSEEQLFKLAAENTKSFFQPEVKLMSSNLFRKTFMTGSKPSEFEDMMIADILKDKKVWVITNEKKTWGAASMLYENNLHELSEQLGSDLYILPLSIHAMIAVPVNASEPNELAEMVTKMNMNLVSLEERLSNQVYHYDKDLRKVSLATDTPNKRLDGIVA